MFSAPAATWWRGSLPSFVWFSTVNRRDLRGSMTANLGVKEIKILVLSLLGGFLLLFPRMLLMHEVAPSLVQTIQKTLEQYIPQASNELEKPKAPAKAYQGKPQKKTRSGSWHVEGIIYEGRGSPAAPLSAKFLGLGFALGV